jgi:hypothetical protein
LHLCHFPFSQPQPLPLIAPSSFHPYSLPPLYPTELGQTKNHVLLVSK